MKVKKMKVTAKLPNGAIRTAFFCNEQEAEKIIKEWKREGLEPEVLT